MYLHFIYYNAIRHNTQYKNAKFDKKIERLQRSRPFSILSTVKLPSEPYVKCWGRAVEEESLQEIPVGPFLKFSGRSIAIYGIKEVYYLGKKFYMVLVREISMFIL